MQFATYLARHAVVAVVVDAKVAIKAMPYQARSQELVVVVILVVKFTILINGKLPIHLVTTSKRISIKGRLAASIQTLSTGTSPLFLQAAI